MSRFNFANSGFLILGSLGALLAWSTHANAAEHTAAQVASGAMVPWHVLLLSAVAAGLLWHADRRKLRVDASKALDSKAAARPSRPL